MTKFGKSNADGSTVEEATECILTKIPVDFENSIREKVKGTNYFYRVIGHQYHRVTDDLRAEWAAEAKSLDKPVYTAPVKASKNVEVKE